MKLTNGVVWPIPMVLDVSEETANKVSIGDSVALTDKNEEVMAILNVEDKYIFDKKETVMKLYCTEDEKHPGVKRVMGMNPILLGGKINLIKRRKSEYDRSGATQC